MMNADPRHRGEFLFLTMWSPKCPDAFERASFPFEYIQQTADLGLLGLTLPTEYGGSAASYVAYGLVCQELERGDSGLRISYPYKATL